MKRHVRSTVTAAIGLLLCGYSIYEIGQVRKFSASVQDVRQTVLEWDRLRTPRNVVRLQVPSTQSMLAPLDGVASFEQGWWVIAIGGGAVFAAGITAMISERRI